MCAKFMAYFVLPSRLTPDFIAERLGHSDFSEVRELDLPHSLLRTVDLGTKDIFIKLLRLANHGLSFLIPSCSVK